MRPGDKVVIRNPRLKQHGQRGTILELDRGNIWVTLETGLEVAFRRSSLAPVTPLVQFTEQVWNDPR